MPLSSGEVCCNLVGMIVLCLHRHIFLCGVFPPLCHGCSTVGLSRSEPLRALVPTMCASYAVLSYHRCMRTRVYALCCGIAYLAGRFVVVGFVGDPPACSLLRVLDPVFPGVPPNPTHSALPSRHGLTDCTIPWNLAWLGYRIQPETTIHSAPTYYTGSDVAGKFPDRDNRDDSSLPFAPRMPKASCCHLN